MLVQNAKGQLISKGLFGILNSPKKRTKKFDFTYYYDTSGQLVFVRFLGEIEGTKKTFRNLLTFTSFRIIIYSLWTDYCQYLTNLDFIPASFSFLCPQIQMTENCKYIKSLMLIVSRSFQAAAFVFDANKVGLKEKISFLTLNIAVVFNSFP